MRTLFIRIELACDARCVSIAERVGDVLGDEEFLAMLVADDADRMPAPLERLYDGAFFRVDAAIIWFRSSVFPFFFAYSVNAHPRRLILLDGRRGCFSFLFCFSWQSMPIRLGISKKGAQRLSWVLRSFSSRA